LGGGRSNARATRGDGPGGVSAEVLAAYVGKDATTPRRGTGLPVQGIEIDEDIDMVVNR